jgi:lipopolysaccharide biosynthesis glycosyltransferase
LFLPEKLKIDKLVYSDVDMLFNCDVSEFYNLNISDFHLIGHTDYPGYDEVKKTKIDLDNGIANKSTPAIRVNTHPYICAGLLLMNIKKIKTDGLVKKMIDEIPKNHPKNDQDILNYFCSKKVNENYGNFEFVKGNNIIHAAGCKP